MVVVAAAVIVVAAVVALAVIVVSLGMVLCLQIVRFSCLLKRRNGRTYGRTDLQMDGPTDRPSYRDAKTHLKIKKSERMHS